MRSPSSSQPSLKAETRNGAAELASRNPQSRWTRRLAGMTRRLTRSEKASLAWRIIAGGTKPGEAHGLLKAWPAWEQIARVLWPVCDIPGAPYSMLCLRIRRYRGKSIVLPDSTIIKSGTMIGELHCNNRAILELVNQRVNPFAACRQDLKTLCVWIQQDARARRVEALYACTILNRAADRLGFTVRPKPVTLRGRLEKFFFKGLLLLYSQEGLGRIQHGNTTATYPTDIWMSRGELLRLYRDHTRLRGA
ncbi:MAG: hypothetical protein JO166_22195, partial [Deltaproteobacteria bacterium]|nr:hypothetical protein [Deltaproteobacteria bacterium]